MPNAPKTPLRPVRVDDELWQASKARAAQVGTSVSEVIREALRRFVKEEQ